MSIIIWFGIGLCVGALFMALATSHEIQEKDRRHDEVMRIAQDELDDAETRIEELHGELLVKQRIIDSQSERINRQRRIIEKKDYNDVTQED